MDDGVLRLAGGNERFSEVRLGFREGGRKRDRRAQLGHRFVGVARVEQRRSESLVGEVVAGRHRERPAEHRFGVAPVLDLLPGEGTADRERDARGAGEHRAAVAQPSGDLPESPRHHDRDPDHRDVGVAVGPGLWSRLDEAEDWQQRHEVPGPPDQQVRRATAQAHDADGDRGEEDGRARGLPRGDRPRIRVESRQSGGPEHVGQVHHARHQRIEHAQRG